MLNEIGREVEFEEITVLASDGRRWSFSEATDVIYGEAIFIIDYGKRSRAVFPWGSIVKVDVLYAEPEPQDVIQTAIGHALKVIE